jgi:hypothetical protein
MRSLDAVLAAAVLVLPVVAQATSFDGITDNRGDFLSTYGGTAADTDLDVVSASVLYNVDTDIFTLTATMDGAIGTTASGAYIWGVNRGAGTAAFAAAGFTGVRFDRVIGLLPMGEGFIPGPGGNALLPLGSITISGNTITAVISGSRLPSTGFANKLDYTWNLWPRDLRYTGLAQISDFAPDNANFTATPVPEPTSLALMLGGLAAFAVVKRRLVKA